MTKVRLPQSWIGLSCGHVFKHRAYAHPNATSVKCPFCGEFGSIELQKRVSEPLRKVESSDSMLFVDPEELEPDPPPPF